MRHRYDCPLRWADLDLFGHINNVRYVDYLQEARSALLQECRRVADVELPEGFGYVVVRHEVSFLAPLRFRSRSVAIDSWVSEIRTASFTLDHEIHLTDDEGTRTVFLRARTVLAPFVAATGQPRRMMVEEKTALAPYLEDGRARSRPVRVDVPREHAEHYPVHVRFSDIDPYRHVNNVTYVEYFQEARIALFHKLKDVLRDFERVSAVVAQVDLEYLAPMTLRSDPYDCWSVVTRMGNRSMTIESELVDGAAGGARHGVLARCRAVVVFFDVATQTAATPPPGYREAISAALGGTLTSPAGAG